MLVNIGSQKFINMLSYTLDTVDSLGCIVKSLFASPHTLDTVDSLGCMVKSLLIIVKSLLIYHPLLIRALCKSVNSWYCNGVGILSSNTKRCLMIPINGVSQPY